MLAEELVVLAAAHGIDLKHVAGSSTETRKRARRRRRGEDEVREANGRPLIDTASGGDSGGAKRPAWTVAELGQAAQGVPRIPWLAAQFSWAGDRSAFWELHEALVFQAYRLKRRHRWSPQIVGVDGKPRFYMQELAQLVLDEDQHAHLFAAAASAARKGPSLYAAYLHIEESLWRRKVYERFDALKLRYLIWLDTARWMIQERLSAPPEETTDEERRPEREDHRAVSLG